MTNNRIRALRKNHSLSQEALAAIINTTQQTVSRMENSAYDIPSDILISPARYFNVTTDYILGISDVKRDLNCQVHMNQDMDQYYDIVIRYKNLSEINRKTFRAVLERLEQAQREERETQGEKAVKEDGKNAEDSNM